MSAGEYRRAKTRPEICRLNRLLSLLLVLVATSVPALAASDPWMADSQFIQDEFTKHTGPRQVIVVFDTSGSMRSIEPATGLTRWQEARAATSALLSASLHAGDSLTILPFDAVVGQPTAHTVRAGDSDTLGQLIPPAITAETGTNMRLAHDRALRMLEDSYASATGPHKPWQAIVVVSDGYNDAPPLHSPAWFDYAKYCEVHKGNENLYPDAPECADWRKLASEFQKSGQGETFGIGVKIEDGVPEYRPPNEARTTTAGAGTEQDTIAGQVMGEDRPAEGVDVKALDSQGSEVNAAVTGSDGRFTLTGLAPGTYTITASKGSLSATAPGITTGNNGVSLNMTHSMLFLWIGLLLLCIVGVAIAASMARRRRASKVRIQVKDSNGRSRTFWIGGGTRVSVGGKDSPGVFPLEVFAAPVVHLRHNASGFSLVAEKGIEVESGGRKLVGSGPVSPNSAIQVKDAAGAQGVFEFTDISTRTRSAVGAPDRAPAMAGAASSTFDKLDANMKG